MEYMTELRKLVGNRPIIMIGATTLLVNQHNQLLMIKRTDNNLWGVPGGGLELGETLEECAKRETLEETGIAIEKLDYFGVYSGKDLHYIYPNGDEVYMVTIVFKTNIKAKEVKLSHEHSAYKFVKMTQMPENLSPTLKPILHDLITKFKDSHV